MSYKSNQTNSCIMDYWTGIFFGFYKLLGGSIDSRRQQVVSNASALPGLDF